MAETYPSPAIELSCSSLVAPKDATTEHFLVEAVAIAFGFHAVAPKDTSMEHFLLPAAAAIAFEFHAVSKIDLLPG